MSFFTFLSEVRFTLYEMILFWIISYSVIYAHLVNVFRFPHAFIARQFSRQYPFGFHHIVVHPIVDKTSPDCKNNNVVIDANLEYLKNKVDAQIRTEQLYTRPHLNIERMAQLLDLPARQLSFLIKQEFHQNYFEFINHYRLIAAKERLVSNEWAQSSIQEIYESVGFSSRSTFFTLFKKREGITPAEYRVKHRTNTAAD